MPMVQTRLGSRTSRGLTWPQPTDQRCRYRNESAGLAEGRLTNRYGLTNHKSQWPERLMNISSPSRDMDRCLSVHAAEQMCRCHDFARVRRPHCCFTNPLKGEFEAGPPW